MKASRFFLALITLIATQITWGNDDKFLGNTLLPVGATTRNCEPAGRILSVENAPQITPGNLLCPNEILQLTSSATVQILCYNDGQITNLTSRDVTSCEPVAQAINCENEDDMCHSDNPRGPNDSQSLPYIISPFNSNSLINTRPSLSWNRVPNAVKYIIQLVTISNDEREEKDLFVENLNLNSNEVTIDYPFEQPLQPGEVYELIVEVITESDESSYKAEKAILRIPDEQTIEKVTSPVQAVNRLNIPQEEKVILDFYYIYMKNNLFTDTREMLEKLVRGGSQNPIAYLQLGQLYESQGLLNLAKDRYKTSSRLASISGENRVLQAAERGLNRINEVLEESSGNL